MVSPTLTTSSTLTPSSVNSEVGMKPEYLVPRSTLISVPVIATTCPVTLSPLYIVLRVSSSISSKDFSTSTADSSTLISSLILFLTSLIIHAGVDAPANEPMVSASVTLSISSSSHFSMNWTQPQCSRTDLGKMQAVGAMLSADDHHCVTFGGQLFNLPLCRAVQYILYQIFSDLTPFF